MNEIMKENSIKKLRIDMELTQPDLSKLSGASVPSISLAENGRKMSARWLKKIADGFNQCRYARENNLKFSRYNFTDCYNEK